MNEMGVRWLSITVICKHLGVSNDTVYKWIDKHGMLAHHMGRLWKFKMWLSDTIFGVTYQQLAEQSARGDVL